MIEDEKGDVYLGLMSSQMERESWINKYGELFHMTPHRHWFYEDEETKSEDVLLGDDSPKRIIGQGKVWLMLNDGRTWTLPSLFHIPSLDRNLISISTMVDVGVWTMFENNTFKMVEGTMVLMWGTRIKTIYKLLGKIDGGSCVQVDDPKTDEILSCMTNSTMLWHQWLGHIRQNILHAIHNKGMFEGILDCKQKYVSFPSKDMRGK